MGALLLYDPTYVAKALAGFILALPSSLFPTNVSEMLQQIKNLEELKDLLFPRIMGGVLTLVGILLFLERFRPFVRFVKRWNLTGATSINFLGSIVLGIKLFNNLPTELPKNPTFMYIMCAGALVLFCIGFVELSNQFKSKKRKRKPGNKKR